MASHSTAGPAHRVQSAVVEYGYPQGHLGHLTSEEEAAMQNFKVLCAERGAYRAATEDGKASHDDATLLYVLRRSCARGSCMLTTDRRFLRARRFSVPDAYQQFKDTEDWRKANQLDVLYETIDLEEYETTRKLVGTTPSVHI